MWEKIIPQYVKSCFNFSIQFPHFILFHICGHGHVMDAFGGYVKLDHYYVTWVEGMGGKRC